MRVSFGSEKGGDKHKWLALYREGFRSASPRGAGFRCGGSGDEEGKEGCLPSGMKTLAHHR